MLRNLGRSAAARHCRDHGESTGLRQMGSHLNRSILKQCVSIQQPLDMLIMSILLGEQEQCNPAFDGRVGKRLSWGHQGIHKGRRQPNHLQKANNILLIADAQICALYWQGKHLTSAPRGFRNRPGHVGRSTAEHSANDRGGGFPCESIQPRPHAGGEDSESRVPLLQCLGCRVYSSCIAYSLLVCRPGSYCIPSFPIVKV